MKFKYLRDGEIFRDIPEFKGLYMVSNYGRVIGLPRVTICKNGQTRKCKSQIIKPTLTGHGYYKVSLQKNRKRYQKKVHRLVAEAFIPNPNNYSQVNHKDEDKTDNCVDNLEWCTNKYNHNYGTRNIRQGETLKKQFNKKTEIYNPETKENKIFSSRKEVSFFLKSKSGNVTRAIKKGYKCNGFYIFNL